MLLRGTTTTMSRNSSGSVSLLAVLVIGDRAAKYRCTANSMHYLLLSPLESARAKCGCGEELILSMGRFQPGD